MNATRTHVLACATVVEEMIPLLPDNFTYEILDFGLHLIPTSLKTRLQEAIDASAQNADTIILGYGLCSMAVVGLKANDCTLVVPRVDDCIAIFLGSASAYQDQIKREPGTYYLTKGWIEVGDTPFSEYERTRDKYGEKKATHLINLMLKNYTRLAYIDTGVQDQDRYREHARMTAEKFNLRYEEIKGAKTLVHKMIHGPWDGEFVVARPGETITYTMFRQNNSQASQE